MEKVNPADEILKDTTQIASGLVVCPQLFNELDFHDLSNSLIKSDDTIEKEAKAFDAEITKEQGTEAQPTNQHFPTGFTSLSIPHPVDIHVARKFKDVSPHHASCIQSKKYSILGLGFVSDGSEAEDSKARSDTDVKTTESKIGSLLTGEAFIESKADEKLDPLTLQGFMSELYRVIEDFLDAGTGYLEVVRGDGDEIIGINWLPYEDIHAVVVKDKEGKSRLIYRYTGTFSSFGALGTHRWYSLFGKENRDWVWDTFYAPIGDDVNDSILDENNNVTSRSGITKQQVSEIIPFMVPSNRAKFYGYPEWLSASSFVTLLSAAMQYKSDFYTNRGVLAYVMWMTGQIDDDKWKNIEAHVQASVGGGNNFKNLAIKLGSDPKARLGIEKLASSDKTELQFASDQEVFAQSIVSAHRVPPVLANILIPGKLGATNEAVQALVSFQLLEIGPKQVIVQNILARTLGGKDGVKGLEPEDFRLRTITSQFDITGLDTIGRAREEAVGANRDFSDGVKT